MIDKIIYSFFGLLDKFSEHLDNVFFPKPNKRKNKCKDCKCDCHCDGSANECVNCECNKSKRQYEKKIDHATDMTYEDEVKYESK